MLLCAAGVTLPTTLTVPVPVCTLQISFATLCCSCGTEPSCRICRWGHCAAMSEHSDWHSAMARERATSGDTAEQRFIHKLAKSLLAASPGVDPQVTGVLRSSSSFDGAHWRPAADCALNTQDPAVAKAFSTAVASLLDGPQKTTLQVTHASSAAICLLLLSQPAILVHDLPWAS